MFIFLQMRQTYKIALICFSVYMEHFASEEIFFGGG